MKRGKFALLVLLCALMLLALLPAAGMAKPVPGESQEMIEVVNRVRAKHGLYRLRMSRSLVRSSRSYARFMLARDYFGHLARIRASSRFNLVGEALAYHFGRRPKIRRTVRRWLASGSHRGLVLTRSFRYLGAARAAGRFGRRRASVWVLQTGR